MLRAKLPQQVPKRLKLLLYGPAGVGKTMAAVQMPVPYVLDCERGTDHYGEIVKQSGGAVFQTVDVDELISELRALLADQHEYRTLVIDPITTVYDDLLAKCEQKVGTQFGRHYGMANTQMKRLINLVTALDMNVIITAHAKAVYGENLRVLGQTFDGWKRLDYMFDLVLELERRGQKRIAKVVKTRIAAFPDGDEFEWSYDAIADRYGRDILEKQAGTVQLATSEQVARLKTLLAQISEEEQQRLRIDKALAGVADMADLPAERICKGIELLERHLGQTATN